MQFWNELEGQEIEGVYPLRRLVRSEGRTAWFETEAGEAERHPATISLTEALTDAEEVTQRLQTAQRLQHANLITISKVGQTRVEETLLVYAIMERADQTLSDVLREQALTKEDARQVAEAMVGALTAIHQKGLVHGRVEPASILAIGETVKLRSDCLQASGAGPADDVAGIGRTLLEAFTQRKEPSPSDPQMNRLPAPFAEIVRNALSGRWTLAQIAAALKPPPASGVSSRARGQAVQLPPVKPPISGPAAAVTPAAPPAAAEATPPKRSAPVGFYAIAAVATLLLLSWFFLHPKPAPTPTHSAVPQTSTPTAASAAPAPAPAVPAPAPLSPVVPSKPAAAHPASSTAATQSSTADASAAGAVWRVVAYTYRREDQARQKVQQISSAHPDLRTSIISSGVGTNHPKFLVTIGGPMDRSHAFRLREKTGRMGFPPDTYVQNFPQ